MFCFPVDFFKKAETKTPAVRPTTRPKTQPVVQDQPFIACKHCQALITFPDQAIAFDHSHTHTFFNPAGMLFEIGCFAKAPGCMIQGTPTTEFSWFPGFAWQHALCQACSTHLGWTYVSTDSFGFFGLILNRLQQSFSGSPYRD